MVTLKPIGLALGGETTFVTPLKLRHCWEFLSYRLYLMCEKQIFQNLCPTKSFRPNLRLRTTSMNFGMFFITVTYSLLPI